MQEYWVKPELDELVSNLSTKKDFEKGPFTIQIIALKKPVDISRFKLFEKVSQFDSSDGYHRYTIGKYPTKESAQKEFYR